jgi:UDPglucose 6-dehydrogenase
MTAPLVIINKSTVPIGTGDWVADIVRSAQPEPIDFAVVSCPEFLREGSAIADFMSPHRNVIGSLDRDAADKVAQLHLPLRSPIVITDLRTAEMIKYASNAFLAAKISFINELADLCELVGADVKEVAAGMGYDARIGRYFLDAGLGWGGSCFPKDVQALAYMAKEKGLNPRILNQVMDVNYDRRKAVTQHVETLLGGTVKGKTIGLLGLAFKENTDDMRDAPSVDISNALIECGARVRGYDPVARQTAAPLMPAVEIYDDVYKMTEGCDALIVVTPWNEFKQLDLEKVRDLLISPIVYDGRNIYDPAVMKEMGFTYRAIGRGFNGK